MCKKMCGIFIVALSMAVGTVWAADESSDWNAKDTATVTAGNGNTLDSDVFVTTDKEIKIDDGVAITGANGVSVTMDSAKAELNITAGTGAASLTLAPDGATGGDFYLKAGEVGISTTGVGGSATLNVGGKSVLTGGLVSLYQDGGSGDLEFKALTHDISNGATVLLDQKAKLTATSSNTTDGKAFSIHDGGYVGTIGGGTIRQPGLPL